MPGGTHLAVDWSMFSGDISINIEILIFMINDM